MPLTPTVVPQFPNVPDLPGVPPLVRAPGALSTTTTTLLGADSASITTISQFQPWGLFNTNLAQVVVPDNVAMARVKKSAAIADYPIEQGSFESYNKVLLPFDAEIIMTKAGTVAARTAFLNQIDAIYKSLNTYSLSMPEVVYTSANVVGYDIHNRTNNAGLSMLTVSIYLQEVRIAPNAQFSTTSSSSSDASPGAAQQTLFPQNPSNFGPVNKGSVQQQAAPKQLQQATPQYSNSGFGGPASTFSNSPFQ